MLSRLLTRSVVLLAALWPVASVAAVTPYPPYPGAEPSPAYKVTVDGQPVFAYRYLTYNQFNWMDYAGFSMTGKVHVAVTSLISERDVRTCFIRPIVRPSGGAAWTATIASASAWTCSSSTVCPRRKPTTSGGSISTLRHSAKAPRATDLSTR